MDDIKAAKALKEGDKVAFKYLFERYYNRLVAYITTYSHNQVQAEDIVQQAFINLWNDRAKLDDIKSPRSYLYAIAYNRYIDSIRQKKKQEKLLNVIWERALRDRIAEDDELLEKRIDKMKTVIESLPPKCKEVIQLNKLHGLKYREIAEQRGISIKTVESQMRLAFKKIRKAFSEDKLFLLLLFKAESKLKTFDYIKGFY